MCTFCNVTITSIIGYDNRVSESALVVFLHHLHALYQSKLIDIQKMVHVRRTEGFIFSWKKSRLQWNSVNLSNICLIHLGHTFLLWLVVYQANTFLLSRVFNLGRKWLFNLLSIGTMRSFYNRTFICIFF